jgi:ABC-type amino acid transport substrate-binding protein
MQGPTSVTRRILRAAIVCATALVAAPLMLAQAPNASRPTLDRLRAGGGALRLGYRSDARPFAYKDDAGQAAGYSVAICRAVAAAAQRESGLGAMTVDWVPVTAEARFAALQDGQVDVLCGAETVSLSRRAQMSFSIPIFAGGVGAVMRTDALPGLREVLAGRVQTSHPIWRAAATQVLESRGFAAVQGTTAETWLTSRVRDLRVIAQVSRVSGYDAGVQAVLDRKADAFFGERAVLMDAARRNPLSRDLVVVDRLFTYEPLALAVGRGDEELRLLIDRTLSRLYASGEIGTLYAQSFGAPDESTLTFFRWHTLPE